MLYIFGINVIAISYKDVPEFQNFGGDYNLTILWKSVPVTVVPGLDTACSRPGNNNIGRTWKISLL